MGGGGVVELSNADKDHPWRACACTERRAPQMNASPTRDAPMLIVACLEMTSGDSGVSFATSKVLRSCGGKLGLGRELARKRGVMGKADQGPPSQPRTCSIRPLPLAAAILIGCFHPKSIPRSLI